jgi:hypothetical protein
MVLPTFTVAGLAVFVTARSFPVPAVVALELLFAVFESPALGLTLAVFLIGPTLVTLTTIVTVAVASLASVPIEQVTVGFPLHVPCVVDAET